VGILKEAELYYQCLAKDNSLLLLFQHEQHNCIDIIQIIIKEIILLKLKRLFRWHT